ncbi:MAG: leucine-rich repeat domain-containing protein, partial [Rhodospirillaceae bacterium]
IDKSDIFIQWLTTPYWISPFMHEHEIPKILAAKHGRGALVLPLILQSWDWSVVDGNRPDDAVWEDDMVLAFKEPWSPPEQPFETAREELSKRIIPHINNCTPILNIGASTLESKDGVFSLLSTGSPSQPRHKEIPLTPNPTQLARDRHDTLHHYRTITPGYGSSAWLAVAPFLNNPALWDPLSRKTLLNRVQETLGPNTPEQVWQETINTAVSILFTVARTVETGKTANGLTVPENLVSQCRDLLQTGQGTLRPFIEEQSPLRLYASRVLDTVCGAHPRMAQFSRLDPQPPSDFDEIDAGERLYGGTSLPIHWRPFVKSLWFRGPGSKIKFEYLVPLSFLEDLSVTDFHNRSLKPLGSLRSLRSLSLQSNKLSSLKHVEHLSNLRMLDVKDNRVRDIGPINTLTNLETLCAQNNKIQDIRPLGNLTQLTDLNIESNKISSVQPLENTTKITKLRLSNNQITEIAALRNMRDLEELWAMNNKIEDIAALKQCENLVSLDLSNNAIRSIEPLKGLTNLEYLCLNNNPVQSIDQIGTLQDLTYLDISHTAVQKIDISANKHLACFFAYAVELDRLEDLKLPAHDMNLFIYPAIRHLDVPVRRIARNQIDPDGTVHGEETGHPLFFPITEQRRKYAKLRRA